MPINTTLAEARQVPGTISRRHLRILQIAGGLPDWGGTEKYVLDLSNALQSREHHVTIACPPGCVLSQRARKSRIKTTALEMRSAYEWLRLPQIFQALFRRFDIVHTHSPFDYVVPAVAARLARSAAIVMTRHMSQPFSSSRNAYICSALLYDKIIAVSGFIRGILIQSGAPAERIEVVPNGIGPATLDPNVGIRLRNELRIPRDAMLIAAAGRMSSGKGFDVLLKAISRLHRSGTRVYCAIFGAGRTFAGLQQLAHELGISPLVRLPGFRTDVQELWAAADIAIIPSVEPESFSYAALEALAAGCAIIATRAGALPEVLGDGSALLIPPGDVDAAADAIRDMVSSPVFRDRMQTAAQSRAKLFTLEANVTGVERVYHAVLARD